MSNAGAVCTSPSGPLWADRVRELELVAKRNLATVRALSVVGGRPALSRCSVCASGCALWRASYMMIDGVFFPLTQTRPLVLLRLSNSGRRTSLGGSRGLLGAGRSLILALAHRVFWAPPRSARTFPKTFPKVFEFLLRKRPSQTLLLLTASSGSLMASSPSSRRV